jgi:hypothetical protein
MGRGYEAAMRFFSGGEEAAILGISSDLASIVNAHRYVGAASCRRKISKNAIAIKEGLVQFGRFARRPCLVADTELGHLPKEDPPKAAPFAFNVPNARSLHVSLSGGKTSTLSITSLTNFASFGNRGKDSNRALQHGQCQR